jgi:hypothetical protein
MNTFKYKYIYTVLSINIHYYKLKRQVYILVLSELIDKNLNRIQLKQQDIDYSLVPFSYPVRCNTL